MVNDIAIVRIVVRVRVNVIVRVIVSGLQKCVANILLLLIITKYLLNKKPLRFPLLTAVCFRLSACLKNISRRYAKIL